MGDARNKALFNERLNSIALGLMEARAREAAKPPPKPMICHCGKPGRWAYQPGYWADVVFLCDDHVPLGSEHKAAIAHQREPAAMINAANREGPTGFVQDAKALAYLDEMVTQGPKPKV